MKQEQRKTERLTEIWIWRFGWPHTKPRKPYRCHYNFPFSGEAQTTACQNLWVHFPHFNTTFSLDLGMLINPNKVWFLHLHDEFCLFRGILMVLHCLCTVMSRLLPLGEDSVIPPEFLRKENEPPELLMPGASRLMGETSVKQLIHSYPQGKGR